MSFSLRRNMLLSELAIYNDTVESDWKEHPTREGQRIRELSDDELVWKKGFSKRRIEILKRKIAQMKILLLWILGKSSSTHALRFFVHFG